MLLLFGSDFELVVDGIIVVPAEPFVSPLDRPSVMRMELELLLLPFMRTCCGVPAVEDP